MPSRNPNHLCKSIRTLYDRFIAKCVEADIDVFVTCTYRSNEEQAELYAYGRTKPGRKKTNAAPGKSKHNYTINNQPAAQAFDVAILRHGKLVWDKTPDDVALWHRVGEIGESCGLKWAGRWKSFKEFPHFEI